jgi:molecular chaperone DnaK
MQKKIRRKKEGIEIKNKADSMVYETEKALKEVGDKISADEKTKVESALEKLKKAMEGDNVEEIKTATEELTTAFHTLSQKMYEQSAAQEQENPQDATGSEEKKDDDNVVDADYEVVDDEDK